MPDNKDPGQNMIIDKELIEYLIERCIDYHDDTGGDCDGCDFLDDCTKTNNRIIELSKNASLFPE